MELFSHINYLAVIVATVVYFLIGFIWYTPLFGKKWAELAGVKMGGGSVVPMIAEFIISFVFALGIAVMIQIMNKSGVLTGIVSALGIIIFYLLPANSGTWSFKGKPALFWIEFGYQSIGALVIGIILGIWK